MKTKRTRFRVTIQDIKKGCALKERGCPVARSMLRHDFKSVYVSNYYARINRKKYELPKEVRDFIKIFDSGNKQQVLPFNFYLNIRE